MAVTFLVIAFVLLTFPESSHSACHGSKTSYRAEFSGQLTLDNRVLVGHVFARFTVTSFTDCFTHCDNDCRCRSFNLPMSGGGKCELNSADNSTVLTEPKSGWRYHHLQVKEVLSGADTCYEPYSNRCCDNNPCANGATCTELGERGKSGFNCTCAHEYHVGTMCEREVNSCFDYLWNDRTAKSGYYDIWEKNTMVKTRVYCEMRPDEMEAWTLMMSYSKGNAGDYERAPFKEDFPRNEDDASSGDYRLSLAKMKSIQNGMEGERKVEWKATCGYSFQDGKSTSDDVVRNAFQTLDLFSFETNEKGLVGFYPFDNVTKGQDKSGFGNHGTMYDTVYEDGPLGNPGGSVRMQGLTSSYIRLHDNSGKLDTRYSLTILMQVYTYETRYGQLLGWTADGNWGVHLWARETTLSFRTINREGVDIHYVEQYGTIYPMQWYYIAATYDYDKNTQSIYRNGQRLQSKSGSSAQELRTSNNLQLTLGSITNANMEDHNAFNGRIACVRIYNTAFTDEDVKKFSENWECPHEPAPLCHRVDYIKIRGRECHNCNVWATQTHAEIFSINAHRGDQKCNFNSGSSVTDENIFGVYKAVDPSTHACANSNLATTQYWFGGRL
ncbi:uncharacterized protein LOC114529940 [Dendronephthya gigantea]|uniref:uncharacterized protein LOC114529940 n=1 Tax=Dendronephthya gigantea TaxID=151771 RepID=UPI00106A6F06|nr:uncharacterized protein LOC114529940 [Dendronephthya gigantea]